MRASIRSPANPAQLFAAAGLVQVHHSLLRHSEVSSYLAQEGVVADPLLVVRDCRSVFNSLRTKSYGRNGITADDPPLRLRLARFPGRLEAFPRSRLADPRYEQFVRAPSHLCKHSARDWIFLGRGDAELPKPADQIADARYGNPTFQQTKHGGLLETCQRDLTEIHTDRMCERCLRPRRRDV